MYRVPGSSYSNASTADAACMSPKRCSQCIDPSHRSQNRRQFARVAVLAPICSRRSTLVTMEAVRLARARELRRLKRTKLRCCPDKDGCNQCLRRGARFLIRAEADEEDEQSLADATCTLCPSPGAREGADTANLAPRSNSKSTATQRLRSASLSVNQSGAARELRAHTCQYPPQSAHVRLPSHLRAHCGSDWALRHGNDIDFPFARQGLATALYRDVPPALRLQLFTRCVLEVALEAKALGVTLTGADDLHDVVARMLARVIDDDANAEGYGRSTPPPGTARGSVHSPDVPAAARSSPSSPPKSRTRSQRSSRGATFSPGCNTVRRERVSTPTSSDSHAVSLDVRGAIEEVQAMLSKQRLQRGSGSSNSNSTGAFVDLSAPSVEELHFEMVRRLLSFIARGGLTEQEWDELDEQRNRRPPAPADTRVTTDTDAGRYSRARARSEFYSSFVEPNDSSGSCFLNPFALLFKRRNKTPMCPSFSGRCPENLSPVRAKPNPGMSPAPSPSDSLTKRGRGSMVAPSPLKLKLEPEMDTREAQVGAA